MSRTEAIETLRALQVVCRNLRRAPSVPEVMPIVQAFYAQEDHSGGGTLHVVLDDHNTEDASVRWCLEYAGKERDVFGEELAIVLLLMSPTQRGKLASGPKRATP